MKIISKDLRDGEKLPERHVFNGMGYQGDNISPHGMGRCAGGHQKLCGHLLRPGCANRLRLVALGCGQPARRYARSAAGFRLRPGRPAGRRHSDAHRFWESRLRWRGAAKGETHRYIFTVHALDVEKIEVDEGASGAMVGFNVHFHSLESASITAMYS